MNYFWSNVFEYFKDRRFASVFFGTLLCVVVASAGFSILYATVGPDTFWMMLGWSLPVVALLFVIWIWRSIAEARARRRDRYKISPLSRDEMRKARSKLVRAK